MKIYNYHAETREHLSESEAQRDPLEPENYLLPANATFIAPIAVLDGEVAVFNGSWSVVKDNRGKVVYSTTDGSEVVIDYLGEIADGFTELPRPDKYHFFIKGKWSMTKETEAQKKKDSVPEYVSRRQFRSQVVIDGLKSKVDDFIANQATELQVIAYEDSNNFYRNSGWSSIFSSVAGLSESEIDDFFIAASKL